MAGSSSGAVFEWGNKVPGFESSYESMRFKGVWYNLHDCVSRKSGTKLPFVGKIMSMFEDEAGARKVRLRWFFRPYELPADVINGLSKDIRNSNELFIGVGNVKGVEDENLVEVIQGKVIVLCTARFGGNMVPSSVHIATANYVFKRAYDAVAQKVLKMTFIRDKCLLQKFTNNAKWLTMEQNKEVEELEAISSDDKQDKEVEESEAILIEDKQEKEVKEVEAISTEDNQSSSINMDLGTRAIKQCYERRMKKLKSGSNFN